MMFHSNDTRSHFEYTLLIPRDCGMARDMETRPEMPRTDGGIEYLASTIMSIGPLERRVGQCRTSPLGSETGVRVHAFFMYVFDFFRVKKDTVPLYPSPLL